MADFLEEAFPSEPEAPVAEDTPAPEIEAQPEPAAEAPAPEPVQEVQQPKEDKSVPLGTFLDMRDKMREAQRERDELKARQQPQDVPDPYDDPEAYRQHVDNSVQQQVTALKFQMSDQLARQVHGGEAVDKAAEWATERASRDPVFAAAYMREPNPIDWIVQQHKRDAIYSQLPTDVSSLEEYIEREIAKRSQPAPTPAAAIPVVAAPAPRVAPPRSIASDVTAPNAPVLDETASFEAIFARK